MKTEKPQVPMAKQQSTLMRIGILVASLIVGVILAIFTMSNPN